MKKESTIMTHEDRMISSKMLFDKCLDILETKGRDYTSDGDVFKDLKEEAKEMCITPEKVLWIAMNKHYKAVRRYCGQGKTESEPIEGRLCDLINYATILYAYIQHERKNENA